MLGLPDFLSQFAVIHIQVCLTFGFLLTVAALMTALGLLPSPPGDNPTTFGFIAGLAGLLIAIFGLYSVLVLPVYFFVIYLISKRKRSNK